MRGGEPTRPRVAAGVALAVLLVAWVLAAPTYAADAEDDLGNWIGANSALRYSDKWSSFLQGEVRTWEPVSNLNELLFRAAGHYDFNKRYMGAFGYVRVDTWPYSDSRYNKFYENRFYQEFLIKAKWGKGKAVHRFRLEQRWITTQEFGREYTNRARYELLQGFQRGLRRFRSGRLLVRPRGSRGGPESESPMDRRRAPVHEALQFPGWPVVAAPPQSRFRPTGGFVRSQLRFSI
jgi:hypothetical protein